MKTTIEFSSYDGTLTLRGTAYVPDGSTEQVPAIVMTHGMADAAARLVPAAEWFSSQGIGVVLYDHRNFFPSDGEPRGEFDPIQQWRDMQMAITFAESFPAFDADRIGLWGTSFSGGIVLAVAGSDARVKAVVAQAPWISGYEIGHHILGDAGFSAFKEIFNEERRQLLKGEPPSQSIAVRRPDDTDKGFALVDTQEGYDYMINGPAGLPIGWANSFTTRSLEYAVEFDARPYGKRITAPLMMILGANDALIPAELAQDFYDSVEGTKELIVVNAEHHSLYMPGKGFEDTMEAATRWYTTHLK